MTKLQVSPYLPKTTYISNPFSITPSITPIFLPLYFHNKIPQLR
jgi:hypothetical protein